MSAGELAHDDRSSAITHRGPGAWASMATMLAHWAGEAPERLGVEVHGLHRHTFASWWRRSTQVAHALRELGAGPGTVVGFLGRSAVLWGEVLVGASAVRAAGVPLNWRLSAAETAAVVADAAPVAIVVEAEFLPLLGHAPVDDDRPRVVVGDADPIGYDDWLAGRPEEPLPLSPDPEDVALVIYTSGTSGAPKGVELSNRAIAANLASPAPWSIAAGDTVMVPAPLFHVSGTGWLFYCLGLGAASLYVTEIRPDVVLDLLASGRVDHALTVPAVVQMLVQHPQARTRAYPQLRTLIYGGSPMSPTVAAAAREVFDCALVQSYGMTETCGPITFLSPADHERGGALLAAAGRAVPGVDVGVFDPVTGEPQPVGQTGEVWTRSALLLTGYRNRPDELAAVLREDGWFRTGDAGFFDDEGYLYLCDRVKDMIVSGGENIYPVEVENALMAHPAVRDVAVIGVPHEKWGETVKAIVVLDGAAGPVSAEELIAFCRERIAHYKCPTSVDLVEELPRNPSGKILKRELRAPFWAGQERGIA